MESKKRRMEDNENGLKEETEINVDTARKMMEGFTREQLLDILAEASAKHSDVAEQVRDIADADPALRKLFVRNLGFDTTTESFKAFFSQFGEVQEGVVIIDKKTGKSKGYGFLTFKHLDGALNALKNPSKIIEGRMTITRLASSQPSAIDVSDRKIFVGNVPTDMPSERLLSIFSEYGEIEEGPLGFDKQPGKSRSFALFIFKSPEGAKLALEEPVKIVDGNRMICKLAVEGQQQQQQRPYVNQSQQQSQPQPQLQPQSHHQLGSSVQLGGGFGNTGFPSYQGLNHNGISGAPNPGNIPGGSMMPSANSSFMNQGLPSNPNTSNPVPSSLGMGGGYGGGYGAPQVGGYNGSQGAGAYGQMGTYGGPPVYGAPAPPSSGGFSEAGRNAQPIGWASLRSDVNFHDQYDSGV
ncbi:hypothetical protein SUGI_0508030 [Cryptomeria japonica]|nr:hypothetical protein SUGI_0508030 [Cryptomeria japonica]